MEEGHIQHEMHPLIEKRLVRHFDELEKGIKHSENYRWGQTGGLPGVHAEILSVNEMLYKIENVLISKGETITEEVFKEMIGYNKRFNKSGSVFIRCGDCNFLTHDIPFIEQYIK